MEADSERPALITMTGLARAADRAADMNFFAFVTPSRYIRMARVWRSAASWSSMSPVSTSAMSPREATVEKPTPRASAQSSIAVTIAPDCDSSAICPRAAVRWAKLASRPMCGTWRPTQLGPRIRSV